MEFFSGIHRHDISRKKNIHHINSGALFFHAGKHKSRLKLLRVREPPYVYIPSQVFHLYMPDWQKHFIVK